MTKLIATTKLILIRDISRANIGVNMFTRDMDIDIIQILNSPSIFDQKDNSDLD